MSCSPASVFVFVVVVLQWRERHSFVDISEYRFMYIGIYHGYVSKCERVRTNKMRTIVFNMIGIAALGKWTRRDLSTLCIHLWRVWKNTCIYFIGKINTYTQLECQWYLLRSNSHFQLDFYAAQNKTPPP